MTQPTEAEIQAILDRPEPAELSEAERMLANAQFDFGIANARQQIDALAAEIASLRSHLQEAGWHSRFSDLELTSPDQRFKAQVIYVGGEFEATITGLMGARVRTPFRITLALRGRQPDCVARLTAVLTAIAAGAHYRIHLDAGGTTLGLEAEGREGTGPSILFGDKLVGEDVPDPAATDDGPRRDPADMSGSPGHDDR